MLGGSQLTTATLPPCTSMFRLEGGSGAVVILAVQVRKSAETKLRFCAWIFADFLQLDKVNGFEYWEMND